MIKHIKCDIFESGADYILHQVNCKGVMGSGIAKQVKDKYPKVYEEYKRWCNTMPKTHLLGLAQFVSTKDLYNTSFRGIVNIYGQYSYGYNGDCYTDYDALRSALTIFRDHLLLPCTIAIPYKMSSDRGGGKWEIVYGIIEEVFKNSNINVLICEL